MDPTLVVASVLGNGEGPIRSVLVADDVSLLCHECGVVDLAVRVSQSHEGSAVDARGELGPAGRSLVEAPVAGKGVGHRPRVGVPGGVAPRVRVPVSVGGLAAGRKNLGREVCAVCVLEVLVLLSVRREGVLLGVGDGCIDIGNRELFRLRLRRGGGGCARAGLASVGAGRRRTRARLASVGIGRRRTRTRLLAVRSGR